jgi:RNA polymerase sigma-70 factor (ECF subfamily)
MRTGDDPSSRVFDDLYEAHQHTLHALFLGRTGDREVALDLLQEVFLRAWRNLPTLEALPVERRHHWLYTVARNLVVDFYRTRGSGQAAVERLQRLTPPEVADAPEAHVLEREQRDRVDAAIQTLPDDLRVVLVLSVLGERTSAEIGEILGRPPGTVRYQLSQARKRLAEQLGAVTV